MAEGVEPRDGDHDEGCALTVRDPDELVVLPTVVGEVGNAHRQPEILVEEEDGDDLVDDLEAPGQVGTDAQTDQGGGELGGVGTVHDDFFLRPLAAWGVRVGNCFIPRVLRQNLQTSEMKKLITRYLVGDTQ